MMKMFSRRVAADQFAESLLSWYRAHKRLLPWREHCDPYSVWVAEIMLQQTQVQTAIPYFRKFLSRYPSLEELARAEESEVLSLWSGLGYYRRARDLLRAAQMVCERHRGRFPESLDEAIQLPGVGRYTAGAVLSIAYGKAVPVVDGNVLRVFRRYLYIMDPPASFQSALWQFLQKLVSVTAIAAHISEFNQALMELGARVCTPVAPRCGECPLSTTCRSKQLNHMKLLSRKSRRSSVDLAYSVAVVAHQGCVLLRRNLEDTFLSGLWEFPRVPGNNVADLPSQFERLYQVRLKIEAAIEPITHRITHRKLTIFPYRATLTADRPADFQWYRRGMTKFPVSSYVSKILKIVDEEPANQ